MTPEMTRPQDLEDRPAVDRLSYPSASRAAFAIFLLVLLILNAYIGRQVLTLLVAPIQSEFDISDTGIGLLQGLAINLCFGLASLPLAYFIDRRSRVRLILITATIWSLSTFLSGFTENFAQMFVCRMLVGVSEAALVPATYSLIADLYPPAKRVRATFIYYAGSLLGASLGIVLIGSAITFLTNNVEQAPQWLQEIPIWRMTFFAAGLSGLPLILAWLFVTEPHRHNDTKSDVAGRLEEEQSLREYLAENWKLVAGVCGGIVSAMIGVDALLTWTPTILTREFGVSPGRAGEWMGLTWGVGSLIGVLVAGILTSRMVGKFGPRSPLQVVRIGAALSIATMCLIPFAGHMYLYIFAAGAFFLTVFIAASTGPVLITDIAPNHLRGRVFAIWVIASATTSGISPAVVGLLSDNVYTGVDGLRAGVFIVSLSGCLVSSILLWIASRNLPIAMGAARSSAFPVAR